MYTPNPELEYKNYVLWHARQALGRHPMSYTEWLSHQLVPVAARAVTATESADTPAFLQVQAD